MKGLLYLMTLSCYLVQIDTQETTETPNFTYVQPVAVFNLKYRRVNNVSNTLNTNIPLSLYLGPSYGRKKSQDEEAELEPDPPHFNSHLYPNDGQSIAPTFESLLEKNDDKLKFNLQRKWTVSDFLKFNDIQFDVHEVTTEDGYILTVFRLFACKPDDKNTGRTKPDIVIYLHGIMSSAIEWLIGDPKAIYPYDAVRRSQEVWLVNFRGNEYGMKHQRLSTLSPAFWKFSFHEQGVYDMPALVEYILKHTSATATKDKPVRLSFLANGLGATIFYIFMDFHGEKYKDKISLMAALTPIAYNSRSASPNRYLIPYIHHFQAFPIDGPFLKSTMVDFLHFSVPELCVTKIRGRSLCDPFYQFYFGDVMGSIAPSVVRRMSEHFPSTTSRRLIVHYLQLYQSDVFRQFDHGIKLNFLYYNQSAPPPYNLNAVVVPTATFYGQTDISIDPRDIEQTTQNFGASRIGHAQYQMVEYEAPDFLYSPELPRACNALINTFISYFNI